MNSEYTSIFPKVNSKASLTSAYNKKKYCSYCSNGTIRSIKIWQITMKFSSISVCIYSSKKLKLLIMLSDSTSLPSLPMHAFPKGVLYSFSFVEVKNAFLLDEYISMGWNMGVVVIMRSGRAGRKISACNCRVHTTAVKWSTEPDIRITWIAVIFIICNNSNSNVCVNIIRKIAFQINPFFIAVGL